MRDGVEWDGLRSFQGRGLSRHLRCICWEVVREIPRYPYLVKERFYLLLLAMDEGT